MATVITSTYAAAVAMTCSLHTTPLASSSTFIVGRESTEVDNTTNKYVDVFVQGKVTVGTTPTVSTTIAIYVWGTDTSIATLTYDQANAVGLDLLTGTDSGVSLTNAGTLSMLKLGAAIGVTAATSNVTYPIPAFSVAALFGGFMPKFWGLYVSHNTGVALNNTSTNHAFAYTGITYTST
jgi:hypothetical protein